MNTTQILNTAMEYLGDITQQYATGIMLASLVFALLNCFMGYRLRKVWGSLLGLFAGAATGAGATYYFFGTEYMLAAALAGAFAGCGGDKKAASGSADAGKTVKLPIYGSAV